MSLRLVACLLVLTAPLAAHGSRFLLGYDEAPSLAKALEQVKAQPQKHVLLYVDMSQRCAPCTEVRATLNDEAVRQQWRRNYVVVEVDLYAPSREDREIIEQLRVSWAPVLVFLDGNGRRVTYTRDLVSANQARLLNEYVSQRQYALSPVTRYGGREFDAAASSVATQSRVAKEQAAPAESSPQARIDDRPRLKEVMSHKPVHLKDSELKKLLTGKMMYKENDSWFLDLALDGNNVIQAKGRRKDGRANMQGKGTWYVTKKGKLCIELKTGGVDENWCRHVFKVGEGYYVSKDLRPERAVYRFVLADR
jgi:thioredoxin-related protein